jgi:F0F1-type ATP synthase beta subunit
LKTFILEYEESHGRTEYRQGCAGYRPTVDCEFPADKLPNILNAIKIKDDTQKIDLTVEVAGHIGEIESAAYRWHQRTVSSGECRQSTPDNDYGPCGTKYPGARV